MPLELFLPILAVIAGFVALVWGADRFVLGAAGIAHGFGVSPLLIGLTIVGFGTSAPEMLVSSLAAYDGESGLGIGNALGSNITNIALVLGVAALASPIRVHRKVLSLEAPVLFLVGLVAAGLMLDGQLSRLDGSFLLGGLFFMIALVVRSGVKAHKKAPPNQVVEADEDDPSADLSRGAAVFWLVLGLVVLLGGAKLLVDNAVSIATSLGVGTTTIGLTVIALGTSLPELAATVVATQRGQDDIAVGNIIGSNMFNLLGVLGLPGLIQPGEVPESIMTRDMPVMLGTLALFWVLSLLPKRGVLGSAGGFVLLMTYMGYMGWLAWLTTSAGH